MIKIKRYILIFSIILILMASCGLVSAASNMGDDNTISADITDMEITESSQTVELIETSESTNLTSDDSLDSKNVNDKVKTNSKASTPVTGNTFQDIQDAIDNANEGDTLELSGTYYGNGTNITINKQLTIQGDENTYFDATGRYSFIFFVNNDVSNVVLKNLNFKNIHDAIIFNGQNGIVTGCSFMNCSSSYYDESGVILLNGSNCSVFDCDFINCSRVSSVISLCGSNCSVFDCCFANMSYFDSFITPTAVLFEGFNCSVFDCDFINCSEQSIGFFSSFGSVFACNFVNCSFFDDIIFASGSGSNCSVFDCYFVNCSGTSLIESYGPISSVSSCSFMDCSFSENINSDNFITLNDNNFINNNGYRVISLLGGGLISNCHFINNTLNEGNIYSQGNSSIINSKFDNNSIANSKGSDIYNEGNLTLMNNSLTNDYATIYSSYYDGARINSPVTLIILDNSTRTAYKGTPFTVYAKLVDDNGNLIEDDRISLNIGSEKKTVFFNEKNGLYEYTLNNVEEPILVSGSYDGAIDLTVKTGYIAFSNQSGGGEIVPIIANGTIDFITNEESVAIILKDLDGKPISNGVLSVNLNGVSSTLLTNTNGQANIVVNGNSTLKVVYSDTNGATVSSSIVIKEIEKIVEKNNTVEVPIYINRTVEVPVYINNTIEKIVEKNNTVYVNVTPNRTATRIIYSNMTTISVPSVDGRIGEYFKVTLVDASGKPLAGKPIQIGFNGKAYPKTTDANGQAKLQINLPKVGKYTFAICYLGDDNYTGSFEVALITVNPQAPKLTAAAKTFKASAKTKTISATFKTANNKAVSGRKITFTINGKTYSATTNSKGVASVKISLNKKGTYSAIAKFEGDNIFKATSTKFNVKIV